MSFEINLDWPPLESLWEEMDVDLTECETCEYNDNRCIKAGYCLAHSDDPK